MTELVTVQGGGQVINGRAQTAHVQTHTLEVGQRVPTPGDEQLVKIRGGKTRAPSKRNDAPYTITVLPFPPGPPWGPGHPPPSSPLLVSPPCPHGLSTWQATPAIHGSYNDCLTWCSPLSAVCCMTSTL
jgi:hypothetical protein